MIIAKVKPNGRKSDLTFQWLIKKYGPQIETWRRLAEEWIKMQDADVAGKLNSLCIFFDKYLMRTIPYCADISLFLGGISKSRKPSSSDFKKAILEHTNRSENKNTQEIINNTADFIEWVLDTHFVEINKDGIKIYHYENPIQKIKIKETLSETVHSPLAFRYIQDLRAILCPKPKGNFSDWSWAQQQNGIRSTAASGWFEVDENQIDKLDLDCVWRREKVKRNKKIITICKIWSPVSAMVLFIKLLLPLRTYQVRMLDSGEADGMRYEGGKWIKNTRNSFALNQYSKGIFRRFKDNLTGIESTGLYINTNKTADQNKNEFERGYEIPWQNEDLLYWLEKLRNWQEKYNPITKPTDCTSLEIKHTKDLRSQAYLAAMGHCCFLMRDATSNSQEDRAKPIPDSSTPLLWYKLLEQLEKNLLNSGVNLGNGLPVQLIHHYPKKYKYPKVKTYFPLHSLRVSLITSYLIDAKLPLPVVSKLLAGHSRMLMTIYYTKLTPAVMQEKMMEAEKNLEKNSEKNIRLFLKDAELRQIEDRMAYQDDESIKSILVNRNPLGWELRHHGLCLAGGNNVLAPHESKNIAGCWNGGELSKDSKNISNRIYKAVSHGHENCVRCRWFITDASYLPALNAHLNFMSYKAHQSANLAVKIEAEKESLEEQKYEAEIHGKPFIKSDELQIIHRRYEKQLAEADEYVKDWIATFNLIWRLIEIEHRRSQDDHQTKLVAVGSQEDIKIGFIETTSELLHLSLLCEDAEIYPDMLDEIKKTNVIQDRTQILCEIMMQKGYLPRLLIQDKDLQLVAVNAMFREMAFQTNSKDKFESFQKVANYLELGQFMQDNKLLDIGMNVLEKKLNKSGKGISIKSLTNNIQNEI